MGDIVQPCGFCPAQRRPANHVRRGTEQHLVGFAVCRSQQAARLHNIRPVLFLLLRPRLRGIGWMPEVSAPAGGSRGMSKVPPHPAKAIFEENCFRHLPLHRGRLRNLPGAFPPPAAGNQKWKQRHGTIPFARSGNSTSAASLPLRRGRWVSEANPNEVEVRRSTESPTCRPQAKFGAAPRAPLAG